MTANFSKLAPLLLSLAWYLVRSSAWGGPPLSVLAKSISSLLVEHPKEIFPGLVGRPSPLDKITKLKEEMLLIGVGKLGDQICPVYADLPLEHLENYLIFWKVLQRHEGLWDDSKQAYRDLAFTFVQLALSQEQDEVVRRLYEFVAGGLHPALVPLLIQEAEEFSSHDLHGLLQAFISDFHPILNFHIVQSSSGLRVPVRNNRFWGPFEGLQLALKSLDLPPNSASESDFSLSKRICLYHGWEHEQLVVLWRQLRRNLDGAGEASAATVGEVISVYENGLQFLKIPFDLQQNLPILRDSLLLAADATDLKYQSFVAKLAVDALREKRKNFTLVKFLNNSEQLENLIEREGKQVRAFFAGLDLVNNLTDLEFSLFLQHHLAPSRTGALLYWPLVNVVQKNSYSERVGVVLKMFIDSLMGSAAFNYILKLLPTLEDQYLVEITTILMGKMQAGQLDGYSDLENGVIRTVTKDPPLDEPLQLVHWRDFFAGRAERELTGDLPKTEMPANLHRTTQGELQKILALEKFNFEIAQQILQKFLSNQQVLNQDNFFALKVLLDSPNLSPAELVKLHQIIRESPGFANADEKYKWPL